MFYLSPVRGMTKEAEQGASFSEDRTLVPENGEQIDQGVYRILLVKDTRRRLRILKNTRDMFYKHFIYLFFKLHTFFPNCLKNGFAMNPPRYTDDNS